MEKLIHWRPMLPIQGWLEEVLSKLTLWRLADMHRVTCQSLQSLHLRQGGFYLDDSQPAKAMGPPNYLCLCQSFSMVWTDTVKAETKEEKAEQSRCTQLVGWLIDCTSKTYHKIYYFMLTILCSVHCSSSGEFHECNYIIKVKYLGFSAFILASLNI